MWMSTIDVGGMGFIRNPLALALASYMAQGTEPRENLNMPKNPTRESATTAAWSIAANQRIGMRLMSANPKPTQLQAPQKIWHVRLRRTHRPMISDVQLGSGEPTAGGGLLCGE